MTDKIHDWYGETLGYSEEEIKLAYMSQFILKETIGANINGSSYDPISYSRDEDGNLRIAGEVTIETDIFCVTIQPGYPRDLVMNFMKAICDHAGIKFDSDPDAVDANIERINAYYSEFKED